MREFLSTPYGAALFILIDIAAVVAVLAIAYRLCCKRLLGFFSFYLNALISAPR